MLPALFAAPNPANGEGFPGEVAPKAKVLLDEYDFSDALNVDAPLKMELVLPAGGAISAVSAGFSFSFSAPFGCSGAENKLLEKTEGAVEGPPKGPLARDEGAPNTVLVDDDELPKLNSDDEEEVEVGTGVVVEVDGGGKVKGLALLKEVDVSTLGTKPPPEGAAKADEDGGAEKPAKPLGGAGIDVGVGGVVVFACESADLPNADTGGAGAEGFEVVEAAAGD
ncbi:unnamed protein product [Somion occarium]|uniref:Uncharacterized protein n=1 Tax=Somion occarium TaxID=3059160 RepID=A0ABP1DHC4_9APHY